MKEINGTVTLAYVEEDNKQRVIFRVIPLCTREGSAFHGGAEDFPDEGSLRVVPDKREQSTFKDRMREIGGLCAIYLLSDGKELVKVRQNRNYAPEQGEKNKLAIYSDVICEFAEDGCFEVLEPGADYAAALTQKILLLKNKMLYGPIRKEDAAAAELSALRPFGNDSFLLHAVETPVLGKRQIYWNPDAVLNWRQRRNALRHREKPEDEKQGLEAPEAQASPRVSPPEPAEQKTVPGSDASITPAAVVPQKTEAPAVATPQKTEASAVAVPQKTEAPAVAVPQKMEIPASAPPKKTEAPAVASAPRKQPSGAEPAKPLPTADKPANREQDAKLPIGAKLTILDQELSFDQHLSRLEQPLSESANRLSEAAEEPEEEPEQVSPHFSGTPLVRVAKPITRSVPRPESVHHVVERQMLNRADPDKDGGNQLVDNPIDNLRVCLDYVWQSADMRAQAMEALSNNESFMHDMLQMLRRRCLNPQATAAAQEQLADIEAERLSLLMQLEAAKANEKKYREGVLASLSQKLRSESEKLKSEVRELENTKQQLTHSLAALSGEAADSTREYMAKHIRCLSGAGEDRLLISPVTGRHYSAQELSEKLRVHMNECGYGCNEDDAMNLLVYFSVNDALCLLAPTETDAARFAQVLLESLGLQSVSGSVLPNAYVEVVSLLPEDGQRTPTVTIQSLGTESMSIYGHKTLFLADEKTLGEVGLQLPFTYPMVPVPAMLHRSFARNNAWEASEPASLSSFAEIRADAQPMQEEAARWFSGLQAGLEQTALPVPAPTYVDIRRFMEVATRKVRGGFLAAADSAVCHWIVPTLLVSNFDASRLNAVFAGLPKTLERLRIQ